MPYPNEHAFRMIAPVNFEGGEYARKEIAPGVSIVLGIRKGSKKTETQAYRFDAKKFTFEQAKKWMKDNKKTGYIRAEKATGEEKPVKANAVSGGMTDKMNQAREALQSAFPNTLVYVQDMTDGCIYFNGEPRPSPMNTEYFSENFSIDYSLDKDGGVVLDVTTLEKVKRMEEYVSDNTPSKLFPQLKANEAEQEPTLAFNSDGICADYEQTITGNATLARKEVLDGVKYLVAPMVMIVKGVVNSLLYKEEDLKDTASEWNGRPVIIRHPKDGMGKFMSANTPENWAKAVVGKIFNTKYEDGRLKGEAWMEEDRLKKLSKSTYDMVNSGQIVEVSTGLRTDVKSGEGEQNGKKYRGVATSHKPDHLAILPDEKGACSIADGAGLNRVNQDLEANGGPGSGNFDHEVPKDELCRSATMKRAKEFNQAMEGNTEQSITPTSKEVSMDRMEKVSAVIAKGNWTEGHREFLANISDEEFGRIEKDAMREGKVEVKTLDDVLANAPADVKPMIEEGVKAFNEKRDAKIATIKANKHNKFTDEMLKAKSMNELDLLANLAQQEAPAKKEEKKADFSAQAGGKQDVQNSAKVPAVTGMDPIPLFPKK